MSSDRSADHTSPPAFRPAGAARRVGGSPADIQPADPARTLWTEWDALAEIRRRAPSMSGLEILTGIQRRELPAPPIHHVLGIEGREIEAGRIVFAMTPQELHYNPMGVVHGGVLSTLLDSALGCAVHSMLPAGTGYTTVDLHVTFVRAVTIDSGELRAEGRAVHSGNRVATAEGRITDASGRLVAHGGATCILMPRERTG